MFGLKHIFDVQYFRSKCIRPPWDQLISLTNKYKRLQSMLRSL